MAKHQEGELPPGHMLLEKFVKKNPLITDDVLCTGRATPKMTDIGRRILSSGHHDVIKSYYQNLDLGDFELDDLVVSDERKLYIRTRAHAFTSIENKDKVCSVLLALRRLHRHLLIPFFSLNGNYALFVRHLSKFVRSPPRQIYESEPTFRKFLEVLYHHCSFAELMDVHYLIIGLSTGYNSLGSFDQEICRAYINTVPQHIDLPNGWSWLAVARGCPILTEVLGHNLRSLLRRRGNRERETIEIWLQC